MSFSFFIFLFFPSYFSLLSLSLSLSLSLFLSPFLYMLQGMKGVYAHYEWHAVLREICNTTSFFGKHLISLLGAFMFIVVRTKS